MRKLNNPMPSGGAPFNNEDLNDVFQTEIWAALQAMLSKYDSDAEGVIVSGCVVTPNASNFDITAGIVYLNGEFMRLDAATNQTFPKYIKAATPTNVSRTFNDSASKTFIIEKKAQLSATIDAGGQEITISSLTSSLARRIDTIQRGFYRNTAGAESQKNFFIKVVEIGDWDMDTNSTKSVAHGLVDYKKIRSVSGIIRDDADSSYRNIGESNNTGNAISGISAISSTTIGLDRQDGSGLDNANYNATSYNRGWLTIMYEE